MEAVSQMLKYNSFGKIMSRVILLEVSFIWKI